MSRLRGIIPPLATPLAGPDELDTQGLRRLLDHVVAGGVHGVFILGTTGECASLSYRLRYELVTAASDHLAGKVPLLVGVTDSSPVESIALAKHAKSCGAAAVVAAPPYYFPITQRDLATHFERLAEELPLPLYLYNMPSCTKAVIELSTYERCAKLPNVIGIKDSGGDYNEFLKLLPLRKLRPDWSLFVGPERFTADSVMAGGDGGVNGGSNVAPALLVAMFNAADRKDEADLAKQRALVQQLGKIYEVGDDFLAVSRGVKCALAHLGICNDRMAPPFHAYDELRRAEVRGVLQHLGLLPR